MPNERARPAGPFPPVKATILTGFLGAGKTTLLNRILRDPAVTDTAVVVNEFGEVGIDHLLVEASGEEVIELSDGCVCCTVRGDLVDTLAGLVDRIQTGRLRLLQRVVVETTGLANPAPVIASLMAHPALVEAYSLSSVVCVVDAAAGLEGLGGRVEAERQIACADRIVVTKGDLVGGALPAEMRTFVRSLNASAPILSVEEADASMLLDAGLFDPVTRTADPERWMGRDAEGQGHDRSGQGHHEHRGHGHHHHHGGSSVRSFSLASGEPIPTAALRDFLGLLGETQGPQILRMKAMVLTVEDPARPLVLHGVRGYLHPPVRLPAWPAGAPPRSRLVLIGDGLDEAYVRDLFSAFTGQARIDAPDRAALLDNPLAVTGMRFS